MIHKDGRVVWVQDEARWCAIGEGRPHRTGRASCSTSPSARRRRSGSRDALEREREATQRLRSLDEMKNTFLQAVSHDLRTPLAAILGPRHHARAGGHRAGARGDPRPRPADRRRTRASSTAWSPTCSTWTASRAASWSRSCTPTDVGALVARVVGDSDLIATGGWPTDTPRPHGQRRRREGGADRGEPAREHACGTRRPAHPVWVRVQAADGGRADRRRGRRPRRRPRTCASDLRAVPAGPGRAAALAGRRGGADARRALRRAARRPRVGRGARRAAAPSFRVSPGSAGRVGGTAAERSRAAGERYPPTVTASAATTRMVRGDRAHLRRAAGRSDRRSCRR